MPPYHFFYVYILKSVRFSNWYIGFTRDLRKRVASHNAKENISTRRFAPWRLFYYEAFSEERAARRRERNLKMNGNTMRELKKRISLPSEGKKVVRGFSTLEMLIAMTVLLLAFSATVMLLPGIQNSSVDTEIAVEALSVTKQALEEQQAAGRKDFKLVVPTTTDRTFGPMTYHVDVGVVSTDYFTKHVTATTTWGGMFNRAQSITLKTIVSNFEQVMGGDTCDSVLTDPWSTPIKTDVMLGSLLNDATGAYPISDLDVYRGRAYLAVASSTSATGFRNPNTGANSTTVGTLAWSNPANVTSSNGSFATRVTNGTASTNYLRASGFGFTIPKGATILGITAEIERNRTTGSGASVEVIDNEVRIVKADGTVGIDNLAKPTTTFWPTSKAYASYGSATYLWKEQWTASDINDPDFGIVLSAKGASASGTNRTAQVDHVRITVSYIPQFFALNIANPTSPTLSGELTVNTNIAPVATGYNAVTVASSTTYGSYAFAATNSSVSHLQVIDLRPANPTVISSYAVPGTGSSVPTAIFFKDGYIYLGFENSAGPELAIIDVHRPLTLPTPLATYEVGAKVQSIYVKNGYAFIGTSNSSKELLVLDLRDLAHPTERGSYNAATDGKSLYTVGDTAYLGTYYSSSAPELTVLDSTSASPTLRGSVNIGTSGNTVGSYGLIIRDYLAFVLTGNDTGATPKFQVYDTRNMGSITAVGSALSLGSGTARPAGFDCESDFFYAGSVPTNGRGVFSIIRP